MLAKAWNTTWVDRDEELRAPFMRLVLLPPSPKLALYEANKDLIYEILKKHSVAVAVSDDGKDRFVRISAQVYNYKEEYYFLRDAVIDVLDIKN